MENMNMNLKGERKSHFLIAVTNSSFAHHPERTQPLHRPTNLLDEDRLTAKKRRPIPSSTNI